MFQAVQDRTDEILEASTWVDVYQNFILTILKQESLNVESEMTLLTACQQWAQQQQQHGNTVRQLMTPMLPHLRLRTMTTDQFLSATKEDDLFTSDEKLQIMYCIMNCEKKMPEGMSDNATPRQERGHAVQPVDKDMLRLVLPASEDLVCCGSSYRFGLAAGVTIHGFRFQARKAENNVNKSYREKFTVTITDEENTDNVATHSFKGKVKYGSHVDILFSKPFPPTQNHRLQTFNITFTVQTQRAYPNFQLSSIAGLIITLDNTQNWCSVSQLLYKK
jgi:BTB And C-terminal Kelch